MTHRWHAQDTFDLVVFGYWARPLLSSLVGFAVGPRLSTGDSDLILPESSHTGDVHRHRAYPPPELSHG